MTIDVEDLGTWPDTIREWAVSHAEGLRDSEDTVPDLCVPLEEEDDLRALLAKHRVLAYHCTRLLEHEVESVRTHGLRPLSPTLIAERLKAALDRGFLTPEVARYLGSTNSFTVRPDERRAGQVCLVLGRRGMFDEHPSGCEPLLSSWGGETIYRSARLDTAVEKLGLPSIVVARIDLSANHRLSPSWPTLGKLLVGAVLGRDGGGADVFVRAPVPPQEIIDVWQPGHPQYDCHVRLPQS